MVLTPPELIDKKKDEFAKYLSEAERRDRGLLEDALTNPKKFGLHDQTVIAQFTNALFIPSDTVYEKKIVVRGPGQRVKVSETVHGKPIFRTQYPKSRIVEFEKQTSATWRIVGRKTGLVIREVKALYYIGKLFKDGKPLLTKTGKQRSGIITWKKAEK